MQVAKIAGLKMCESFNLQYGTNYIAVMPTNLYGPNDFGVTRIDAGAAQKQQFPDVMTETFTDDVLLYLQVDERRSPADFTTGIHK